ncbi:EamA family transporter [Halogeometricum sp. S1BR25-6]|uniref:EamA family transporter n=1 Tax=Halogeometricum salsisoli TaxID=2950536 RepID=A0ABU2GCN5_9EURY|nr:EamA family transporter [Halogeometricum sp. S1BR25-6]MDS0298575.1 EamA family transporter [Halogeometricum sp. S1BR25-6]
MNYLPWALLALGAYAFVAPLMSVATTGTPRIPSNVAALIANTVLVVVTAGVVVYTDADALSYVTHPKTKFVLAAGLCLTVGILSYYRALSMGPVSVVAPIFGMFLALSSLVGIVFLNESFTARKGLGIALAVVAVYLVSVE